MQDDSRSAEEKQCLGTVHWREEERGSLFPSSLLSFLSNC